MNQSLFKRFSIALKFRPRPENVFLTLDEVSVGLMLDKVTIFARFNDTQKVQKGAVFKTSCTLSQMNVARRWIRDTLCD